MIWRIFSLLLFLAVGAGLGYVMGANADPLPEDWAVGGGALLALLSWWLWDTWRGLGVIAWLREGDLTMMPHTHGLWGEVVDRVRRLIRLREQALVASDQRLKDFLLAIQASPNGVVLLDQETRIEWCNQTASEQLGIDVQRDMMQRIGNLLRDPVFARYMAQDDPIEGVVIEGRSHRPDRPQRLFVQRHRYGEGKELLMSRDVTEVEKAEVMRRDFVANVSHEIRTPLTVLAGFVETMQTLDLTAEDRTRYLATMAAQSQRMQSLVDDLLTLSRLEGSPEPGADKTLGLAELLKACELEAHALSARVCQGQTGHVIRFELEPSLTHASLIGEPKELQSALSNLVSNAIRYTPPGGAITVKVHMLQTGELSIAVSDTGLGIPPEHVTRLTERFYRVDKSRSRDSGGTGLGLAIVKHVMSRHKGALLISSTLGQGSCFELRLPAARLSWSEPRHKA